MTYRSLTLLFLCVAAVHAAPLIKASLVTNSPGCEGVKKVALTFRVEKAPDFTPPVQSRLIDIWKWFEAVSGIHPAPLLPFSVQAVDADRKSMAVTAVEVLGGGAEVWTPDPRHPNAAFAPPRLLKVCLTLHDSLPQGSLDAKLTFASPAGAGAPLLPTDLSDAVSAPTLVGRKIPTAPTNPAASGNAAKGFVRELDFAGIVLSSVQTTAGTRARTTKAVGDFFFAPIFGLRFLSHTRENDPFATFFTPIAVEAHASNQPITRDTLSQNRIVMGPEFELRRYFRNAKGAITDNLVRVILSFKSASDRDFKLIEPKFAGEFRPIWGKLNIPIVEPKALKGTGHRRTQSEKIGRVFSPVAGFEEGKSILRGIPASAATPLGRFSRAYFGGDAGIDFDHHLAFTTTQIIYVRGEANYDAVHYMRNTAQWTFLDAGPAFASSVFVSFEKGRLPPFRSTANAVTIGIRIQSSDWHLGGTR